jgi:hypothetical protein
VHGSELAQALDSCWPARPPAQVVAALQWVPGRRGAVAAAVTDPASHEERLAGAGRPRDAHVLVWNFRCVGAACLPVGIGQPLGPDGQGREQRTMLGPSSGRVGRPRQRLLPPAARRPAARDPIRPECVLECPHEVTSFQFNPINPSIVAGGCLNGQVRPLASGRGS